MPAIPFDSVISKWNSRASEARAQGVPMPAIQAVANYDIQRVKQGSQPMTKEQAQVALSAAATGQSPLGYGTTPANKGVGSIPGNIGRDIGGIVKGFIPGLAHMVTHPTDPNSLKTLIPMATALIPGVGAPVAAAMFAAEGAQGLMSSKGRQEAAQHPVSTLLQFLPGLGEVGKAAGTAGLIGADAEAGSAGAEMAAGRPLRAAGKLLTGNTNPEAFAGSRTTLGRYLTEKSPIPTTGIQEKVNRPVEWMLQGKIGQTELVDHYISPLVKPQSFIEDQYMKLSPGIDRTQAFQMMQSDYVPFFPDDFGFGYDGTNFQDQQYMIPRHISNALDDALNPRQRAPRSGVMSKFNKVFRTAVLGGPRTMISHTIGGLVLGVAEDPGYLLKWRQAGQMISENPEELVKVLHVHPLDPDTAAATEQMKAVPGSTSMPPEVLAQQAKVPLSMAKEYQAKMAIGADQILAVSQGKTLARWWQEAKPDVHPYQRWKDFQTHVDNLHRVSMYERGLAKGMTEDEALTRVNQTFIDWGGMSSPERSIFKTIFPFYSHMKSMLKLLARYPSDHPIRAAALSKLAETEATDWGGADQSLWSLIHIGSPDSNGNIRAINFAGINPLRSISNPFSLAAFTTGLYPPIGTALTSMGVNLFTATSDLYPKVQLDPATGKLVAARRENPWMAGIYAAVPETQVISGALGFSNELKTLKKNDPNAYKRLVYSNLTIPFAPSDYNIYQQRFKPALDQLQAATSAVSEAKAGAGSDIKDFQQVPYKGQLVDPRLLLLYLQAAQKQASKYGLSAKALGV